MDEALKDNNSRIAAYYEGCTVVSGEGTGGGSQIRRRGSLLSALLRPKSVVSIGTSDAESATTGSAAASATADAKGDKKQHGAHPFTAGSRARNSSLKDSSRRSLVVSDTAAAAVSSNRRGSFADTVPSSKICVPQDSAGQAPLPLPSVPQTGAAGGSGERPSVAASAGTLAATASSVFPPLVQYERWQVYRPVCRVKITASAAHIARTASDAMSDDGVASASTLTDAADMAIVDRGTSISPVRQRPVSSTAVKPVDATSAVVAEAPAAPLLRHAADAQTSCAAAPTPPAPPPPISGTAQPTNVRPTDGVDPPASPTEPPALAGTGAQSANPDGAAACRSPPGSPSLTARLKGMFESVWAAGGGSTQV